MTEPLSCPYCNALVVPPAGARAGQRVPCARCGETFTLPASFEIADDGRSDVPVREAPPAALPQVRRWPNALVAALVVGSMMLLAALVLRFAVLTKDDRRNNDRWAARPERVPLRFVLVMLTVLVSAGVTFILIRRRREFPGGPGHFERSRAAGLAFLWGSAAVTVAVLLLRGSAFREGALDPVHPTEPTHLEGLRYLSGDTNVIVALHVGEILENPESEQLLNLSLPRLGATSDLGTVRGVLDRLEQMTKLRREVIDHIVLGAKLSGKDFGRVQLIVRTRKDYDRDRVRVALNARSHPAIEGRERHLDQFHQDLLPGLPDGLLGCPDARTVVLGWNVTRLLDMPTEPRENTTHLPVSIMGVLKERMRPWGQVWVAGHTEEWSKPLLALLALARLDEPDRQFVSKLKTFAVWLNVEEKEKQALHAALRCSDAAAAEAVETALASRFRKDGKPDSRLKLVRNDEWVTLQFRIGNDTSPTRP
ncbi:MAG: hypothetical protein HYS12_11240 [Planctomycetes bacterium]|nr:hypothetical protein [Planctomycetota bacterium]